jgi:holliday junction DNA helicase RuvA
MIASLNGQLQAKTPAVVIVDVNGVGYEVFISTRTYDALAEVDQACFLHVHTVVREDALMLYGFSSREEKELFLLLVTVSGIGPKLAQTILSGISVHDLEQAILLKDLSRLTAIPGVGKKTAQRICVELGEKVGSLGAGQELGAPAHLEKRSGDGQALADAASALVNLGYPQYTAWQALRAVQQQLPDSNEGLRVEELIRLALQSLVAK